jgi:threonine dehydratase
VAQIGERPFALAQQYVDEVITVTTDELCAAINLKTAVSPTNSVN